MSYISQRIVKSKKYYYLEESFEYNKKLIKESVYFGSISPSNDELFLGYEILKRTCLARNHTVIVPPLTEFIRNRTAKLLKNAKNNYSEKINKLNKTQLLKLKETKINNLVQLYALDKTTPVLEKNLSNLFEYYNEGILKKESLTEIKIRKLHSLLTANNENKNEEYDSNTMHLFLTWYKEKTDLIHEVEFAAKFCAKFYNLKLFQTHNFVLAIILMNYILEQKQFPFVMLFKKRVEIFKKVLEEGKKENFKPITTFLIKEVIKQSKIKIE